MKQLLLLVFSVFFLSNCKQSTLTPETVTDNGSTVEITGFRKARTETVVILGSSTAAGWGASMYKYSWAGMLTSYLPLGHVINLAKGGYTSYQILPSAATHPSNRPSADTLRNITAALKKKPTTLIISVTTNDIACGYGVDEIIKNISMIRDQALASGVGRVIITTSHPRNINSAATAKYLLQRDKVLKNFGVSAVNIFDPVADSTNLFKAELLCTDGVHPNDKGHQILFEQIKKAIK